jgi:hypothetical protein
MISVKVSDLRRGDEFQVTESASYAYTVTSNAISGSDRDLHVLKVEGRPDLTMPGEATLYATRMVRAVKVPCVVHGDEVLMMHDYASGSVPHAVLCGDCDAAATAQVMAWMAEKKEEQA